MLSTPRSLLEYYTTRQINPVPIALDTQDKWSVHVAKRRKLYERHLGIPLSLMRGQRVLEVGCNSGENAMVLADAGARLTLVEPNASVHSRLRANFAAYDLSDSIESLFAATLESFSAPSGDFSVVIAEGFLSLLARRDAMLKRLFRLAAPGGIVVTSYSDSYGMVVEAIKRAVLKRACEVASVSDWEDQASYVLARTLFFEEFSRIPASRPFEAWWKDTLVSPFMTSPYFWTLTDVLPMAEQAGFGVLGTSPRWDTAGRYSWYKSIDSLADRHREVVQSWRQSLPFFLSGNAAAADTTAPASDEVLAAILKLVGELSDYTTGTVQAAAVTVPDALLGYIAGSADERFRALGRDLAQVPALLASEDVEQVASRYRELDVLRTTWGMPYHYLSFIAD
jgi:SAM-dependent methyltransferase